MFYLIAYLKDPEAPYTDGIWMCAVYSAAVFVSAIFRNKYIFDGYLMAIRMRKAIVSSMYDKVAKLSTKSLTETNSGKLITIISGDVFNVERATCITPLLPAAPIIVSLCLFYISWSSGIEYAAITLVIWLLCLGGQLIANAFTRKFKMQDAQLTDQRMKLINDLVSGIRTIKSYAWENHYLQKIKDIRAKQHWVIYKFNSIGAIGYTFFQNAGFIVVLTIFVP